MSSSAVLCSNSPGSATFRARACLVLAGALALAACGDGDDLVSPAFDGGALDGGDNGGPTGAAAADAGAGPVAAPVYAIVTDVDTNDTGNSYLSLVPSLNAGVINLATTREFPGSSAIATVDGDLLVSDIESNEIRRYAVGPERNLTPVGSPLSFGAYDITATLFGTVLFDSTRAYQHFHPDTRLLWNPQTMTIVGETAPFPAPPTRDGLALSASSVFRGAVVDGSRIISGLYWMDEDRYKFGPTSAFAIFDAASQTPPRVIDLPCPFADILSGDEDGTVYATNWIHSINAPLFGQTGPRNCIAWLARGESQVAATNVLTYRELTGGHEGAAFRYYKDGRGVMAVFREDQLTAAERADTESAGYTNHWELWWVDLRARSARPVDGLGPFNGAFVYYVIDGRALVLLPDGVDFATTSAYELSPEGAPTKLFTIPGRANQVLRVR